ncbi:ferredoxin [Mycobacterium paraintracellulare]|nr:ferredoxin [Mycobacterium avium subsp. hominissuis]BCO49679.1 ferredoxin [Mycobacterium paraintracellulare]BCO81774.1 ferredoxin [Mycobacterium paraintracellulare]BCO86868.1 ferredoxin [Mycobacterium paraintracellulare]
MTMKVRIETGLCEGHGQCVSAAPQVFDMADSDEIAHVVLESPPESMRGEVEFAQKLCPTKAVIVDG